jgi:methyl-accepting chemotaxis protein
MSIRVKLFLLNLCIVVPFLVTSGYSILTDNAIKTTMNDSIATSLPNLNSVHRFQPDVLRIQQILTMAALMSSGETLSQDLSSAQTLFVEAGNSLSRMTAEDTSEATKEAISGMLKTARDDLATFYDLGIRVARAFGQGNPAAGAVLMKSFDSAARSLGAQADNLSTILTHDLEADLHDFVGSMSTAIVLTVIMMVVALGLAVLFALLASGSLAIPLRRIAEATSVIARGDLSGGVDLHRRDEIGVLAENFNGAIGQLRQIVRQIKSSAVDNRAISTQLSRNLEQTVSAVTEIASNIESINKQFTVLVQNISSSSSAVEEIFANINSLAAQIGNQASAVTETSASIEEMSASIESVARIAREKEAATTNLKNLTEEGGRRVDTTYEIVTSFSKSADDMLEMIQVINDVANRTNLLSMNAAIEAAHAGQFGKGFAVVADEIRKLAESTGSNAKKISQSLQAIIEQINQALEASRESGDAFRKISAEVAEVVNAFSEISLSTKELAVGSKEILASITSLIGITEEIRSGSAEMRVGAQEVNNSLLRIKDISTESLTGMREIGSGAGEISSAVVQISDLSVQNQSNVDALGAEIARFKIGEGSSEDPEPKGPGMVSAPAGKETA